MYFRFYYLHSFLNSSNENDATLTLRSSSCKCPDYSAGSAGFIVPDPWPSNVSDLNSLDFSTQFGDRCRNVQWRRNDFESGGGTGPERKWGRGTKIVFFGRAPPLFGSKSTIGRFGERFHDDQYSFGQFLVCCSSTHGNPVHSHL